MNLMENLVFFLLAYFEIPAFMTGEIMWKIFLDLGGHFREL